MPAKIRRNHKNRKPLPFILILACAILPLGVSLKAFAQSDNGWSTERIGGGDTENRIRRLENEIETLSQAVYRGQTPPPSRNGTPAWQGGGNASPSDPAAQAAAEIRMDQLEQDLRTLTGRVEEMTYELNRLKATIGQAQDGVRATQMTAGSTAGQNVMSALSGQSAMQAQDTEQGVVNYMNVSPQRPASDPDTLGILRQPQNTGAQAAVPGTPAALYDQAFSVLKQADYDQAEKLFEDFISKYPGHGLAANAWYWLGETYYVRGNYEKAAKVFAEAYQKYPDGAKTPDNLLKLGMSLAGMGNRDDACIALMQLEKDFSGSGGPVISRARQEMSRLSCQ